MIATIKKQVQAFDNDDGLPEAVYQTTAKLLADVLGEKSADAFCRAIDATDGRFYLKTGTFDEVWREILAKAKPGSLSKDSRRQLAQ